MDQDPYVILGVSRSCSDRELRSAYRRRVKETHTDLGGERAAFEDARAAFEAIVRERERLGPEAPLPAWAEHTLRDVDDLRQQALDVLGRARDRVVGATVESAGKLIGHAERAEQAARQGNFGIAGQELGQALGDLKEHWQAGKGLLAKLKRLAKR